MKEEEGQPAVSSAFPVPSVCDSRLVAATCLTYIVLPAWSSSTKSLYARVCAGPPSQWESKSVLQALDQEPTIPWRDFLPQSACFQSKLDNPHHSLLTGLYCFRDALLLSWPVNSSGSETLNKLSYSIWIFHVLNGGQLQRWCLIDPCRT